MPTERNRSMAADNELHSADHTLDEKTYKGSCFCGAVQLTVSGEPAGMGYCHCESCRSWSAGPVNAFTLWKPEAVEVTQGEDKIGEYHKNEEEPSPVVHGLRRPPADAAPGMGFGRCLRCDNPHVSVRAPGTRQLRV